MEWNNAFRRPRLEHNGNIIIDDNLKFNFVYVNELNAIDYFNKGWSLDCDWLGGRRQGII